ncbi:MAG: 16S rRNA (cytosine(1402)-N(4))-methyltransferase RsmH [Acidimicrobiia bacterium]|nr:16S rRNA (cytosine(1402)-N(4))-methyltransferase RsmH [Acidimicrobiia bacterium]
MSQRTEGRYHDPVMVNEVVELFQPVPKGVVVDATFGGGGHTAAILRHLADDIEVVAIDRDPDAVAHWRSSPAGRLAEHGDRLRVIEGNFGDIDVILDSIGVGRITGALFDLGVSSHQLDAPDRGFSYRARGPLDMRMGPDADAPAAELVNEASPGDLERIIRKYGEERHARRIVHAIVAARPISDTHRLAEVVRAATPAAARRSGGDPARRTFQALRIAVNDELTAVDRGVASAIDRLAPGGRCVVISYHSLEDRIVAGHVRRRATVDVPPGFPVEPEPALFIDLAPRALRPTEQEIADNRRARSARLRAVERRAA